jgi:RHS repeat-associated protein
MRYVGPLGSSVSFAPLINDGAQASKDGRTLRRLGPRRYQVAEANSPTMEFELSGDLGPAPLRALVRGRARVEFRYARNGTLQGIIDSTGRLVRVECDALGRVLRLTLTGLSGRNNRELVVYWYDEAGNLVRGLDAYRHSFSFAYDVANQMVRRTDRRGYSFYFSYDGLGRCVRSRGEDGLYEVRLDYHPEERRTLVTQADGGVWEYKSSERGFLTEIVDPYAGVRAFRYDALGRVAEEVDPNGDVTRWVYNNSGYLLGKRSSLGHFSSSADGPLRPDQRAHRTPVRPSEWEFGDLLTSERLRALPGAVVAQAGLPDLLRQLVMRVLQHGSARSELTKFAVGKVRDELGTLIREVAPDGRARHWNYDAGGNAVRYHDFDGSMVRCEYSSWDLPNRRMDPIGRTLTRHFTAWARLAELVDPAGVQSAYIYDLKGRLSEFWYDGVLVEGYRYDASDNLVAKLDRTGRPVVSTEIGPKNLKTVRRLASGETHRFAYTERGYYAGASADEVSVKFDYDQFSNRTLDERDGRGVEHLFDGPRSLARTTVLKRFTTQYRWLSSGTLNIRDPGGRTHQIYFLGGGVVARGMSSGLAEATRFDDLGQCLAKASSTEGSLAWEAPWVRQFSYSGEGDLLEAADSTAGNTRYEYDAAHRLCQAIGENGTQATFRQDMGDNLLEQPGLASVSIASGNRLLLANGDEFEYDGRGNIATRRGSSGVTHYRYDSRNMLVSCQTASGEWFATYDPLGRRVRKSLDGAWREFYWDTDRLAAELHYDGRLRVYVYPDAFAMVPLLWLDYDDPEADPATGRRYFLQCDHIGTPVHVQNEAGDIVWQARVAPYGSVVLSSNASVEMPLRFPGHYFDPETGLHYNRFRYYSPELGRYLQPDPLGTVAGNNLYAYSANPLKAVDVRGDCPVDGTDNDKKKTAEDGEPADESPDNEPSLEDIAKQIADGHAYDKHVVEEGQFPDIESREDFADHIFGCMINGEEKPLNNGRTAWWDADSGTVVIHDPNDPDSGTAFRPTNGKDYFDHEL